MRQSIEEPDAPCVSQGVPDKSLQNLQSYSRLDSWLEEIRATPSVDFDPFFDGGRFASNDMARSVSDSTESLATSGLESTVKPDKRENAGKKWVLLADRLRTRLVCFEKRIEDPMTATLKSNIVSDAGPILLEQTKSLRDKMELFLSKTDSKTDELQRSVGIYDIIEELSDAINEWRSTAHMATITNRDFDMDLKHCRFSANEAVFQRTVIMSILNRHQISDKFNFNCEAQWSLRSNYYALPSTEENSIIPDPKPDLAIFFRFESLFGNGAYSRSTPIPDSLKACMSPDGSIHRCFPFIFIEAKNVFHDLGPDLMANMHSASQALFNIYVWMSEAGHQDKFFSDVRLFSIAINSQTFALRVHRAQIVEGEGEGLQFSYDDICKGLGYKRDDVCNLIRNILVGYAEKTLLDVLKQSVLAVSQNQRRALKRKSEVAGLATSGPPSKRTTVRPLDQVADPSALLKVEF
ncbi:hypothetical protein GGS24DRAFT_478930 [Hypoxylon argillaceum]|nr:hypothetical protein GGS24DRAFT_478930 [Hypoxylon argillaceum]